MSLIPLELHNIIHTIANEDWQSLLNKPLDPSSETEGKLVIYRQLQQESLPPSYVLVNMTAKRCWTMAAIHGGCLPLAVERGHFHVPKLPLKDRLCTLCNTNSVEDVSHFVLFCPKYNNTRLKLYNTITSKEPSFYSLPPTDKLTIILSNEFSHMPSMYLNEMFILRLNLVI